MTIALLYLLLGFILAVAGGEVFVRGCVGAAGALRIPNAIVAVTIAAFATSSPEFSVAVTAALAGAPEIALGNVFGGNLINVALVLGVLLCFGALPARRGDIARDWLLAVLAPLIVWLMANDGQIDVIDGAILITCFIVWLVVLVVATNRQRRDAPVPDEVPHKTWKVVLCLVAGLALLIASGDRIVVGAEALGTALGLSPFLTGVTLVAIGTSMPEMATGLVARLRGHDEVGLGTVLGSNIFNLMVIVGTAAVLHPVAIDKNVIWPTALAGIVALVMVFPNTNGEIPRWRAFPLLALYAASVVFAILSAG